MKLTIELVPSTSWYSNVRSNISREQWDVIRKACYAKAMHRCEICDDHGYTQGFNHTVECHEVWDYVTSPEGDHTQVLIDFIALCPHCHKVKHAGLAKIKGEGSLVISQLMSVNNMNHSEAVIYIEKSFEVWRQRSKHKWDLDISVMDSYLNQLT